MERFGASPSLRPAHLADARWRMRFALCLLSLALSAAPLTASAQSNDEFFPKDFARSPQQEPATPVRAKPTPRKPQTGTKLFPEDVKPSSGQKESGEKESFVSEGSVSNPLAQPTPTSRAADLTALTDPLQVVSIGAILSGVDKAHLQAKLDELVQVAQKHDFDLGDLYVLGKVLDVYKDPRIPALGVRGGMVHVVSKVPDGYKVTMSPTWLVRTSKGVVILEGMGPLEQHFNGRGEYLDRKSASPSPLQPRQERPESAPQTPTPKTK